MTEVERLTEILNSHLNALHEQQAQIHNELCTIRELLQQALGQTPTVNLADIFKEAGIDMPQTQTSENEVITPSESDIRKEMDRLTSDPDVGYSYRDLSEEELRQAAIDKLTDDVPF